MWSILVSPYVCVNHCVCGTGYQKCSFPIQLLGHHPWNFNLHPWNFFLASICPSSTNRIISRGFRKHEGGTGNRYNILSNCSLSNGGWRCPPIRTSQISLFWFVTGSDNGVNRWIVSVLYSSHLPMKVSMTTIHSMGKLNDNLMDKDGPTEIQIKPSFWNATRAEYSR